jgi:hypothetical protein
MQQTVDALWLILTARNTGNRVFGFLLRYDGTLAFPLITATAVTLIRLRSGTKLRRLCQQKKGTKRKGKKK